MPSRKLQDLTPETRACAELFLNLAHDAGLDVLIYCTRRSCEEQARLYRQGRTSARIELMLTALERDYGRADLAELLHNVGPQYGPLVTNAAPGQSLHNYGLAFDAVPMRHGKPIWNTAAPEDHALWELYGALVAAAGLDWAGKWQMFRELPHAQLPGHDWRELMRAGGAV